jgi:hypothetical protein
MPRFRDFLKQDSHVFCPLDETVRQMEAIAAGLPG